MVEDKATALGNATLFGPVSTERPRDRVHYSYSENPEVRRTGAELQLGKQIPSIHDGRMHEKLRQLHESMGK
jgi:hypothetical protein